MALLQTGLAKSLAEDYTIDQSLRFERADPAYLSRTPGSAGSLTTWTWSGWVKRGDITNANTLFGWVNITGGGSLNQQHIIVLRNDETISQEMYNAPSVGYVYQKKSEAVLRDPSAWYHIVSVFDSTNSTEEDRSRLYINGERVTAWSVDDDPAEDLDGYINTTVEHGIGAGLPYDTSASGEQFSGLLAEVYFIDGQALDADDFGETDTTTNQWKPIDAVDDLTFGTNGFYQKYGTTTANTTFTDVSSYGHTITANGGMVNSAAQVKYGSSSALFGGDGSGDYLEIADSSAFDLGTGDFTLEAWVYPTSDGSYRKIFVSGGWGVGPDGEYDYIIDKTDGGALRIQLYDDDAAPYVSTTGTMTLNAWNHVAAVRSGTTVSLYIDGTASGTMTGSWDLVSHGNPQIGIQTDVSATTQMWDGYIAGVRISNSARYTGNFTPSTGPYTSDANTMFLLDTWDGGLGEDSSGNNNTFAVTNLVATDQMKDSPTNNFSTLNPLNGNLSDGTYFSEGNLESYDGAGWAGSSTIEPESGKWYAEFLVQSTSAGSGANESVVGIVFDSWLEADRGEYPGSQTDQYGYYRSGQKVHNGSFSSYGDAYVAGDIIGVALDLTNDNLYFSKNNAWQNSGDPTSGATGTGALSLVADKQWAFALGTAGGAARTDWNSNFGADSSFAGNETAQGNQDSNGIGDFYYEPPTDFLALCTSNLDAPSIKKPGDNFNTILYDDGAGAKTGVGFQPDLVWVKSRGSDYDQKWTDSVRGVTKAIVSNDLTAETTDSTGLTAFGADGFTVGADTDYSDTTGSGMAAWNWLAGTAPTADNSAGAGATPTAGSVKIDGSNLGSALAGTIAATRLSANTTSGFSIISYTGTGSVATIAHGLSQKPEWFVIKSIDYGRNWLLYNSPLGATYHLIFDGTNAANTSSSYFNNTEPTASVITLGTDSLVNDTEDYVAYCFHSVEGYSKVGSYVGNGNADGVFIYTGFRPSYIICKNTTLVASWMQYDATRSPYNILDARFMPNTVDAEGSADSFDFLSNGFKNRTSNANFNADASTYVYVAFAKYPFKYANAR